MIDEPKKEEILKTFSPLPNEWNWNSSSNCLQFQASNLTCFHKPKIYEFSENFTTDWKRNLLDLSKIIIDFGPGKIIWKFKSNEKDLEILSCREYSIKPHPNEMILIQNIGEAICIGGGTLCFTINTQGYPASALIWNILLKNSKHCKYK